MIGSLARCAFVAALAGALAPDSAEGQRRPPRDSTTVTPMACVPGEPCAPVPEVEPMGTAQMTVDPGARSYAFTVRNVGGSSGTIAFTARCEGSAVLPCSASPSSATMASGSSRTVTVNYTASANGGPGVVYLKAEETVTSTSSEGWINIEVNGTPTYTVTVAPLSGATSVSAGSNSYTFRVTNTGNQANVIYDLAPICANGASGCGLSHGAVTLSAGQSADVTVSYTAAAGTNPTVGLTAWYRNNSAISHSSSVNIAVAHTYTVEVRPKGDTVLVNGGGILNQYRFVVRATGSTAARYYIFTTCTYPTTDCRIIGGFDQIDLVSNRDSAVFVEYRPAAGNQNRVGLTVHRNTEASDEGWIIPTTVTYGVQVTTPASSATFESFASPQHEFRVRNTGSVSTTYTLTPSCSSPNGGVSNCGPPPPFQVTVQPNTTASVYVTFNTGSPGTYGTVSLSATGGFGTSQVTGSASASVTVASHTVEVSTTPTSATVSPGSYTQSFTVKNTGNVPNTYDLTPECTVVTGCPTSLAPVTLIADEQTTVNMGHTISGDGTTGAVKVTATYASNSSYTSSATYTVSTPHTYTVQVTPDTQTVPVNGEVVTSARFIVRVTGSAGGLYNIFATCSPAVTLCQIQGNLSQLNLTPQRDTAIFVDYRPGGPGSDNRVALTAYNNGQPGIRDEGSYIPQVLSPAVYAGQVTPKGASVTRDLGTRSTQTFWVKNVGTTTNGYTLRRGCDRSVVNCPRTDTSVSVARGDSAKVDMGYDAGSPGQGSVWVVATGGFGSSSTTDSGWVNVSVAQRAVSVTTPLSSRTENPGTYTQRFTVYNPGNIDGIYDLTRTCSGGVTGCSPVPAQVTVAPQASVNYDISFTIANYGDTGSVKLAASFAGYPAINSSATLKVKASDSYWVVVLPKGVPSNVESGVNRTVTFFVRDTGTADATYTLKVVCTGSAIDCPASSSLPPLSVLKGQGKEVPITFTNSGSGVGQVSLVASFQTFKDSGWVDVRLATYTVSITPKLATASLESGAPGSQQFKVKNVGNTSASYTLSVGCPDPGASTCGVAPPTPSTLPVGAGDSANVTVNYVAGPPGATGRVWLAARTGAGASTTTDTGSVNVTVISHAVTVTPEPPTATVYAGRRSVKFTVKNTGNVVNSYTLTLPCSQGASGAVSGCQPSPTAINNLAVNGTQEVTVSFDAAGAGGSGTVSLTATNTVNTGYTATGTVNVTVTPTYTVAVTPKNGTAEGDAGKPASVTFDIANNGSARGTYRLDATCSGPGVAAQCAADSATVTVTNGQSARVAVRLTAGQSGTATIKLVAKANADTTFADSGSVNFTAVTYAVAVSPDGVSATPAAFSTNNTRQFMVANRGTTQRTFAITLSCGLPAIASCSSNSSLLTLTAGDSLPATVTYTAGEQGATGTLRLVAADTAGRSVNDGSLAITVGTTIAQTVVRVKELNPGTSIERSQCLVFAIVSDVASECGALRITHPLPSVRTLGKTRTPTLIYYSDHVQGPTIPVDVILASSATIPTTIRLVVRRTWPNGTTESVTRDYTGSTWNSQRSQRIAMPAPGTGTRGTGILRYTVEVRRVTSTTNTLLVPAITDEMAVVDRSNSPFGAGWWLAGLEQLFPGQYDGSVLWVGGDGSTRKYMRQATPSGTDTVFLAAVVVDRPDTLLRGAGGKYRRQAGNGLFTEFDGMGRHRRTVNRLGYETVFDYDSSSRLISISVPPWKVVGVPTPAHSYAFGYNATTTRLATVTAPPVEGKNRIVRLEPNGTQRGVRRIIDDLGGVQDTIYFHFQTELKYQGRLDRRRVRTEFVYEALSPTVGYFATATGLNTDSVRHTFRTASAIGAGSAVTTILDSAYFRYDGPRLSPILDHTKFWVNGRVAPTRIRNALSKDTYIVRGDPRFPAVVTEARTPTQFITWAAYDARGNIRATMEVNPRDDGKDAITLYQWHPRWDMTTNIVQPEGDFTTIAYDSATGDRIWQEDGRGSMSRVNIRYYETTDIPNGAMARLVRDVEVPPVPGLQAAIQSIRYDSVGNVDRTTTARGAWTVPTNDGIGRTIRVSSQIYLDSAHAAVQHTTFDLYDRVKTTRSVGPATNFIPQQELLVENVYDKEGRLESVSREASDAPGIGRIVTRWQYDNLGRAIVETAPDNAQDRTWYDFAGNVDSVRTRRGHKIWMTYDPLNRLMTRTSDTAKYAPRPEGIPDWFQNLNSTADSPVDGENPPYPRYLGIKSRGDSLFVPGDSAAFDYDVVGNMTRADNRDARVRRTYYRNGQLKLDSLYIRTVTDTLFNRHRYGLEHTYDRAGRRTLLKHPDSLVLGATYNGARYTYDPLTGALATVRDVQGNLFTYKYNARGEVESLDMPHNVFDKYRYDQDGNLAQLDHGLINNLLREASLQYDARGKIIRQANAKGYKDVQTASYSGLGHVVLDSIYAEGVEGGRLYEQVRTNRLTHDALGNLRLSVNARRHRQKDCPSFPCGYEEINSGPTRRGQAYVPGTGRYAYGEIDQPSWGNWADTAKYDEAGNTVFTRALDGVAQWEYGARIEDRASFYAADGKLYAADYRWVNDNPGTDYWATTFEEYRYDALGRRVWLRSRRFSQANGSANIFEGSLSFVRRTVWDGSAELYEIQMPGWNDTNADSLENDTQPVKLRLMGSGPNDPNPSYGRVAYTHGLGIDRPLSIVRFQYSDQLSTSGNDIGWAVYPVFTIVPAWNTRGRADERFFPQSSGAVRFGDNFCIADNRCAFVSVPAVWDVLAYSNWNDRPVAFAGTLLDDKRDKTGTWYRRNRSYDPNTGRFTQEDPIGLAGGMNLYGFANGDPANFSDPYGLCPKDKGGDGRTKWLSDCPTGSAGHKEWNRMTGGSIESAPFSPLDLAAVGVGFVRVASRVALDANVIIPLLEGTPAEAAAIMRALAGRAPSVSITAVKEYLRGGGNIHALRTFLQSTGGSVGRAATGPVVRQLMNMGLDLGDARVVGSAMMEGIALLTRDKGILRKIASASSPY